MDIVEQVKGLLQSGKLIIGRDRVMKSLNAGDLAHVYVAKNIPAEMREDIEYYCALQKVEVSTVPLDNEELGILAKRGHFIAVLGLPK